MDSKKGVVNVPHEAFPANQPVCIRVSHEELLWIWRISGHTFLPIARCVSPRPNSASLLLIRSRSSELLSSVISAAARLTIFSSKRRSSSHCSPSMRNKRKNRLISLRSGHGAAIKSWCIEKLSGNQSSSPRLCCEGLGSTNNICDWSRCELGSSCSLGPGLGSSGRRRTSPGWTS